MADLYTYALTDVASVKELMGIASSNTSRDNLIKRKINQATDIIEGYCLLPYNHHFKEQEYTDELYEGTGGNTLLLGMRPLTAVSSFSYGDGIGGTSFNTLTSDDYAFDSDSGRLLLNFNAWGGFNSYRVSYTAGFSTIPSDLAEACAMLAANLVEGGTGGAAIQRKREGAREVQYAVSLTSKTLIDQLGLGGTLNRYVRVSVGGV